MIHLELTEEEAAVVNAALVQYLSDDDISEQHHRITLDVIRHVEARNGIDTVEY